MAGSTTSMRKRINVDDVQIGMYCADVFNSEGVFVLAAHIPISNLEQIAILKRLGVKHVDIDILKGADVSAPSGSVHSAPASQETGGEPSVSDLSYVEEIPVAKDLYRKTIQAVHNAIKAIKLGKPFSAGDIELTVEDIVESVLRNPDALVNISQIRSYDDYVYRHSVNVTILVCAMCHDLGYAKNTIVEAGIGAFLHDLGMTWIPENIVNKPDKLSVAEYDVMKRHPDYGIEIIKNRKGIAEMSRIVIIQHHERMNGKGYPKGLKYGKIHEMGAVGGIADAYDAMTSDRVHRAAFTPQQALAILYNSIDKEFPRAIVERFVKMLGVYPVGSFVQLASGEKGIVQRVRKENLLSPDLLVLFADDGKKLKTPVEYQLSRMDRQNDGKRCVIDRSLNPRDYQIKVEDFIKEKIIL